MNNRPFDDREILLRLHRHLMQTMRAASLLQGEGDDCPEVEQARCDVDAAIASLKSAVAAMEALISQQEADTDFVNHIGDNWDYVGSGDTR